MFTGIVGHVLTYRLPTLGIFPYRKGELGIDESHDAFSGSDETFVYVGTLQLKVHTVPVTEILEEGHELSGFSLLHHLNTGRARFPVLVDGNDHPKTGDGKVEATLHRFLILERIKGG